MLRIDTEVTHGISEFESFELIKRIHELLIDADVLIFEDYDKGVLTADNIKAITAEAHKKGIPVVVDPKKRNFAHYHKADLFKPNLKELRDGLKLDFDADNKASLEAAVKEMMRLMDLKHAMITMSERGVMITDGNAFHYVPAHVRKIADVSGAGDTVVSVAALCFALKLDIARVAHLANLAGGLVCEEVGVVPIDKARFESEIKSLNL
jgi:rfaE bifunctional protein kinase chain/domain